MLWHTASFQVGDIAALVEALGRRKDMEYEEEEGVWVWLKKKKKGRGPEVLGDTIVMGRIQLLGDEAVLEVNSEKRYKEGRKLLERIPGVTFLELTTRPVTRESLENRPLDDRLPSSQEEEIPPEELVRVMEEELRKLYMRWLDEPIPALGGKTPRRTCSTEAGKRRVAAMIRSIPSIPGPGGLKIQPPRKEMLKELGLEET